MNFGNLFDMDNIVWKYLGRLWDAMWLTILWLLCSLPIITIGASSTAVCYVALKIMKDEEGGITKQFFSAFKQNFKQATLIWLGALFAAVILAVNLWFYYHMSTTFGKIFLIVLIVLTYVYLMILHYIFFVLARFSNSIKKLLIMAFVFAMKNFGWTLFMITATVCMIAVGIFGLAPLLFVSVGVLALLGSWIMNPIFDKYIEENHLKVEE